MNFKKMKLEDLKKLAMEKISNSKKEVLINFLETFESSKKLNPIEKIVELYERLLKSEREKIELLKNSK